MKTHWLPSPTCYSRPGAPRRGSAFWRWGTRRPTAAAEGHPQRETWASPAPSQSSSWTRLLPSTRNRSIASPAIWNTPPNASSNGLIVNFWVSVQEMNYLFLCKYIFHFFLSCFAKCVSFQRRKSFIDGKIYLWNS